MTDVSPPSLASLPTQLLTSAPPWFWRYASVVAIAFLMAVGGDYYLGSPVVGYIRAVAAQKVKVVEVGLIGTHATPDADTTARIDALETQAAKISSMQDDLALKTREFKALETTVQYTIGRVGTLETYMADKPVPLVKKVKPVAVNKPVVVDSVKPVVVPSTEPVVKIGGSP